MSTTAKNINKRKIAVMVTAAVGLLASASLLFFDPGSISRPEEHQSRKASIPEASRSYGEKTDISLPKKEAKRELPKQFEMPFQPPDFSHLYDRIPTTIPEMTTPKMEPPKPQTVSTQALSVYARHVEILDKIKGQLNSGFKADTIANEPKVGDSKFSSAYVLLKNGESMERLDLMSLVRNEGMRSIKTAKDALNALVEEANEVHIIEQKDDYLIYDISGTRGYQVGKISVDDNGIHISGYVNLTTNRMPEFLKKEWVDRLRVL